MTKYGVSLATGSDMRKDFGGRDNLKSEQVIVTMVSSFQGVEL